MADVTKKGKECDGCHMKDFDGQRGWIQVTGDEKKHTRIGINGVKGFDFIGPLDFCSVSCLADYVAKKLDLKGQYVTRKT